MWSSSRLSLSSGSWDGETGPVGANVALAGDGYRRRAEAALELVAGRAMAPLTEGRKGGGRAGLGTRDDDGVTGEGPALSDVTR